MLLYYTNRFAPEVLKNEGSDSMQHLYHMPAAFTAASSRLPVKAAPPSTMDWRLTNKINTLANLVQKAE